MSPATARAMWHVEPGLRTERRGCPLGELRSRGEGASSTLQAHSGGCWLGSACAGPPEVSLHPFPHCEVTAVGLKETGMRLHCLAAHCGVCPAALEGGGRGPHASLPSSHDRFLPLPTPGLGSARRAAPLLEQSWRAQGARAPPTRCGLPPAGLPWLLLAGAWSPEPLLRKAAWPRARGAAGRALRDPLSRGH